MKVIVNNIFCQVEYEDCDYALSFNLDKRLRNKLQERIKGYQFTEAHKDYHWDGYHKFYSKKRQFFTGFLVIVLKYCEDWDVSVTISDIRKNKPKFNKVFVNKFGDIELREDQTYLLKKIIDNTISNSGIKLCWQRGILNAAPNAGKTVTTLGLYYNLKDPKVLFLTREFVLFVQTVEFFEKYISDVGVIYGSAKHTNKRWRKANYSIGSITVAMTTTLTRKLEDKNVQKDLLMFNTLVVDECHYATSNTDARIILKTDAALRLFLSGTPFSRTGDKVKKLKLIGMSGMVIGKIGTEELVNKGISRATDVHIYLNQIIESGLPAISYREQRESYIHFSKDRCEVIYNEIMQNPTKTYLIVYYEIKHGLFMYDYLMEQQNYNVPTILTNGADKDRFTKIEMFLNKQVNVLFVNKIIRQGVNMPLVDVLIYTTGGLSDVDIEQWLGRPARTGSINDRFKVIDFYDIGSKIRSHSLARLRIYKESGHTVTEHYDKMGVKKLNNRKK